MIAVVVRQNDQIDRWQVSDLTSRLGFAPRPDAMTQEDVLAFVQKGGVGQDCQSAEADQCGRVTDEVDAALLKSAVPLLVNSDDVIVWPPAGPAINFVY